MMRAFHLSAYIIPQMTNLRIGLLGDFGIGQVYNLFVGRVTNDVLWGRGSEGGLECGLAFS